MSRGNKLYKGKSFIFLQKTFNNSYDFERSLIVRGSMMSSAEKLIKERPQLEPLRGWSVLFVSHVDIEQEARI